MAVQTLTVAEVSGLIAAAVMVGRIPSPLLSTRECITIPYTPHLTDSGQSSSLSRWL